MMKNIIVASQAKMSVTHDSRRFGTDSAFGVAVRGHGCAVAADTTVTLKTHTAPLEDQTQSTQTYTTLPLLWVTTPTTALKLQKLILQFSADNKERT